MTLPRDGSAGYYGRPIVKPPVWKDEIAWYLFCGGMAGASSTLAFAAQLAGRRRLARTAGAVSAAALTVSPALLIKDLGRPDRFLHMLRVVKPTSPMNIGTWLLSAAGAASTTAAALELTGRAPRARFAAAAVAGTLGPLVSTYTAVLLADTAVPVWHEARRDLPLLFAAGSAASAGAASTLFARRSEAAPARRLMLLGAVVELTQMAVMERRLGGLAEPYSLPPASRFARAAKGLTLSGATIAALGRRGRYLPRAGAALVLGGALAERFAVFRAGFESARDPKYVIASQKGAVPQPAPLRERSSGGAAPAASTAPAGRAVETGAEGMTR